MGLISFSALRRISVIALGLVLISCGHPVLSTHSDLPGNPWVEPVSDVSVVWSAGANIDLLKAPAVVLRAYVESYFLAVVSGDIERVYPGFTRAVPPPSANDVRLDGTASRWPDTSSPVSGSLVGTKRMEILRIDVTENHATAVVCDWSLYTVAWDLGNGEYGYRQSGSPDSGVQMIQVNMTAPKVTTIPSSMPPQMGPSMSPTDDVFGGWRIDAAIFAADKPHWDAWPTQDRDYEACSNLAPDSRERREFLRTGEHPRSDYPTLRPFPGWPVASSA